MHDHETAGTSDENSPHASGPLSYPTICDRYHTYPDCEFQVNAAVGQGIRGQAARFQLYALTHNLANFMRSVAMPETVR
jgi:hypothetical protein